MLIIIYFIIGIICVIIGYNYTCIQYKKRDNIFKHYSFSSYFDFKAYDITLIFAFFFWPIFILIGILYYPVLGIFCICEYIFKMIKKIHKIE